MRLYVVDAFSHRIFGGNQAGVVLLEPERDFPEESLMRKIAAELKHSETAFVKIADGKTFQLRYFTPEEEVDLCGHATISAFTVLREEKKLAAGNYFASTAAGELEITVEPDRIWMEMAPGRMLRQFTPEESSRLYRAFGLHPADVPDALRPCIVSTGLSDILLPVSSEESLDRAEQNRSEVMELSKKYSAVGVHMYCAVFSSERTAACRNFAPLVGIDEEAATGSSNGALTWYLSEMGFLRENEENLFLQGSRMGRPSVIRSRVREDGVILIGGSAVISVEGDLRI